MTGSEAAAIGVSFTWIGLVLGISFIEAPLKFRAPGVTVRIGLGIGRLVFRAVNAVEVLLAVALVVALVVRGGGSMSTAWLSAAVLVLAVQVTAVRPALARRSDLVLAGGEAPRSHAHLAYVVLEVVKLASLLGGGTGVLVSL